MMFWNTFIFLIKLYLNYILASEVVTIQGPAFAESISEGDIRWLKRGWLFYLIKFFLEKGDFVKTDDLVAEIETDKVRILFCK